MPKKVEEDEMVAWDRVRELLRPAERVLDHDLKRLRAVPREGRGELLRELECCRGKYEKEIAPELERDIRWSISGKFSLARLLLATAAYLNGEEEPFPFSQLELSLVQDFEKFAVFDILSVEEIVERIARRDEIYELIMEVYRKQYASLDALLDSVDIQRDLKVAFKSRYKERLDKIKEGVKAYVDKFGPIIIVGAIERKVWEKVKESEREREKIAESLRRQVEELSSRLAERERVMEERERLEEALRRAEVAALTATAEKEALERNLAVLKGEKDLLLERYLRLEEELASHMEEIDRKRQELLSREAELEAARREYRERMEEEKQRIVESELREVEALRAELESRREDLDREKERLSLLRAELDERVRRLSEIAEGASVRYVTREEARFYELDFIARFDDRMHRFPIRVVNPIDGRKYEVKGWDSETHRTFSEGLPPQFRELEAQAPHNLRSRYIIGERKYRLFGEKMEKVIIEAVSFTHLREHLEYGFDTRRMGLAEFLALLSRFIDRAQIGRYFHVIGIASPTGFDERIRKEIASAEFAHNYFSRYVSVCLLDPITGELLYSPADERILTFIELFRLERDPERVERVKKYVGEKLLLSGVAVFREMVKETGEKEEIVKAAFYRLEQEGRAKVRNLKDLGLVLESG